MNVAVAEAVNVLVAMIVPTIVLVILSRRRLFCFDFGIKKSLWLPRCCCFEKETEEEKEQETEKETETETGEGKWMALFRDLIFCIFSTDFFAIFLLFLANLKGILEFFLEFIATTYARFGSRP